MGVKLIVATSQNNVIGVGDKLPWNIPAEMAHFKRETKGSIVLMGRKTWESIPKKYRPLVDRTNVVISRQKNIIKGSNDVFPSIGEFLYWCDDFTVIGGSSIYKHFLENDLVDEIVLSIVDKVIPDSPYNIHLVGFDKLKFDLTSVESFDEFKVYRYKRKS